MRPGEVDIAYPLVLLRPVEGLDRPPTPDEVTAGRLNGDESLEPPDVILLMNTLGY